MTFPIQNSDQNLTTPAIPIVGNVHKTLPHNGYRGIGVAAYCEFMQTGLAIEAGAAINFRDVPKGPHYTRAARLQSDFHARSRSRRIAARPSPTARAAPARACPPPTPLPSARP